MQPEDDRLDEDDDRLKEEVRTALYSLKAKVRRVGNKVGAVNENLRMERHFARQPQPSNGQRMATEQLESNYFQLWGWVMIGCIAVGIAVYGAGFTSKGKK